MNAMDIKEIMEYLPHRYPFLLIDRVLEFEPGKRIVALKNVTVNEPFFPGHFPRQPVMPGVLILEAMAQAAAMLAFKRASRMPDENSVYYFVGIDDARFKRPVVPGDQLSSMRGSSATCAASGKFSAEARVGERRRRRGGAPVRTARRADPPPGMIHPTAIVHPQARARARTSRSARTRSSASTSRSARAPGSARTS